MNRGKRRAGESRFVQILTIASAAGGAGLVALADDGEVYTVDMSAPATWVPVAVARLDGPRCREALDGAPYGEHRHRLRCARREAHQGPCDPGLPVVAARSAEWAHRLPDDVRHAIRRVAAACPGSLAPGGDEITTAAAVMLRVALEQAQADKDAGR